MGIAPRVLGAVLLLLMVIGAIALWVAVPAAVLWLLGKLISNPTEHLILGLITVPAAMLLFGILLGGLNTAYLRISGVPFSRADDDWEWTPRLRGPLDRILAVSAIAALAAFLAWMILGDTTTGSVPPW